MSRRQLIAGAAVIVGGWYFFLRDDDDSEIEDVVRNYYAALDSGDQRRANELIHSEAPQRDAPDGIAGALMAGGDVHVNEIKSIEVDGDTAHVRADVYVDAGIGSDEGTARIELRTEDGDWKIWRVG